MMLLLLSVLVALAAAVPPHKFPRAFPAKGVPHHFGNFFQQPHRLGLSGGFPFASIHPGFPFNFLGGLGSFDGSCPFYTTPEFIEQLSGQIEEGQGGCDIAGCTIASHVTLTLEACNSLTFVSQKNPKGVTRPIPTAQPAGTSTITIKCTHGYLSVEGLGDEEKAENGVLVIDQLDCFPCRFYTTAPEVVAAVGNSKDGSVCTKQGICDLVDAADIKVHSFPGAGYDLVYYRDFHDFGWLELPKHEFSFNLLCKDGLTLQTGLVDTEDDDGVQYDIRVITPNHRFPHSFFHPFRGNGFFPFSSKGIH